MSTDSQRPTGTVTFLFTDVAGSTRRWEESQGAMREAMTRHDTIVRSSVETRGGTVFTTAGDSFCAAFSAPTDALDAAVAAQQSIESESWGAVAPFRVRMALHSGNADERDGDYFGPPLNRCARLLSIGHGGQILVSLTTEQLLRDALPPGLELVDLGAHRLRDLDREEHVFQVEHASLERSFPSLRSESPVREAADQLAAARQAHSRDQWRAAYGAYQNAAAVFELDAEDVQRYGDAAWWSGKNDEAIELREKAYATYLKEEAAAMQAIELADAFGYRLAGSVASGWSARAERLLEGNRIRPPTAICCATKQQKPVTAATPSLASSWPSRCSSLDCATATEISRRSGFRTRDACSSPWATSRTVCGSWMRRWWLPWAAS